ncbi:flagellar hook-associated protein FlgK [Georgenia sp. AZ-5]|uniref:flagellar hook-associated protein FlgK n=1 Tax=Georgenia sp. AZ-5 TaxID=3367526 RepID=UPI003753E967
MSTFGALNTAYTGLVAAQAGLETVGQNVVNANTEGYTRQRVRTSATVPLAQVGMTNGAARPGQGVTVDGVARLGDALLDARVHTTASAGGYTAVRADALASLETLLAEPGEHGLAAKMQSFWASWQDLSNQPDELAPAGVVLENAAALVNALGESYRAVDAEWTRTRENVQTSVDGLNTAAARVANLNQQIRSAINSGGSANELIDRRSAVVATMATLAGATVHDNGDGTLNVLLAGNAIVDGTTARSLQVTGAVGLADAAAAPVRLEWTHRPGTAAYLDGGKLAGSVSLLAPADAAGKGGLLAEAAASYDALATTLAQQVNAVHRTGTTPSGATGTDFFAVDAGAPPALGLRVAAAGPEAVATGTGGYDGSVADAISQIGVAADSPDRLWAGFVTRTAVASSSARQQAALADVAATSAVAAQLSNASVSLDEENINLLALQRAYQGAARVLTAVDEMLDVLINRTGRVGL